MSTRGGSQGVWAYASIHPLLNHTNYLTPLIIENNKLIKLNNSIKHKQNMLEQRFTEHLPYRKQM